jgi:hypothetical protein
MWEKKEMEGIDEWWQGIRMTYEFDKRKEHHCVPFKKERDKNGKNQTKRQTCFACNENSKTTLCGQYYYTCNKSFCTASHKQTRDFFKQHVEKICRTSDRVTRS